MSTIDFAIHVGAIAFAAWYSWNLLRRVFFKSQLDNISGPPCDSILRGVFPKLFSVDAWDYHRTIWQNYDGSVVRFKGPFNRNHLYVYDPKALHHILIKEQDVYQQEPSVTMIRELLFGPGLLTTLDDHHRKQRKMLNPVFSITHMRKMMPIFYNIVHKLELSISNQIKDGPKEIDMLSWMGRTALELISQTGFGFSFDDLAEEHYKESSYSIALKKIVPVTFRMIFARAFVLPHVINLGTAAFRRKAIDWIPMATLKEARDLVDVIHKTSLQIYDSKKQALNDGNEDVADYVARGKDILSILMKANMAASEEDRLPDEEIYSQISTFAFAGTDTTSNALARTLWLLAKNKDVQDRLRAEIKEAMSKTGDNIPYDELVALPYMDAICRETLRLYSPVPHLTRKPKEDIVLPLLHPIKGVDGSWMKEILVPKGTKIHVSLIATNRDKDIWGEDAEEWKPERWLKPLPDSVANAKVPGIYSHLMTFSAGSRACIGFKFSQLEMKTVLSLLISRFDFSISQEIFWQMSNIITPVVKHAKGMETVTMPELPLMVKRAT